MADNYKKAEPITTIFTMNKRGVFNKVCQLLF